MPIMAEYDIRDRFEPEEYYRQLDAPEGVTWPRASIRAYQPGVEGAASVRYAAKLWKAPGVPAREKGLWVTFASDDLGEVMDWAALEVFLRHPWPEVPC